MQEVSAGSPIGGTNPSPVFKTLKCSALSSGAAANDPAGSYNPCQPNSREPVPFETDIFKGHCLLLLRTKPVDTHFNAFFEGKKRELTLQLQGKFKRCPVGEVYCGVEVTSKMELGILLKSISRIGLNFVKSIVSDMHHSFGDYPNDPTHEHPHIVAPLVRAMDRLVVTPDDQAPPPIHMPFIEEDRHRQARIKNNDKFEFTLDSIYSFSGMYASCMYLYVFICISIGNCTVCSVSYDSIINTKQTQTFNTILTTTLVYPHHHTFCFPSTNLIVNTSNVNLPGWSLVKIPMIQTLDIRRLIGAASLRFVAYDLPHPVGSRKHVSKELK